MAANYTVTKQEEVLELGDSGLPQRVVQITFKTLPSEVTGTVRLPVNTFSADAARILLEAAAAEREAVASL